jgi:nucleoporin NDC1
MRRCWVRLFPLTLVPSTAIWTLLPFSTTGLRTASLFSCGFAILILRIAHYHVGVRTASSPARALRAHILTRQTAEAVVWYTISSAIFLVVHVIVAPERSGLSMVAYTPARRAILNEKPIYFMCAALLSGVWQALMHRFFDEDRLDLSVMLPGADQIGLARKDSSGALAAIVDAAARAWLPPGAATAVYRITGALSAVLPSRLPDVLMAAFARSVVVVFSTFPAYFLVLRGPARSWALKLIRPFVSLPRSNAVPHGLPVDVLFMLRCAYAIFHLMFIWYVANQAFSTFMARPPLKNGQPLTADSKDANGSLLNGLRNKKLRFQVGRAVMLKVFVVPLSSNPPPPELCLVGAALHRRRPSGAPPRHL